jgi:pro-apoptotic serine protease NMA111
MSAAGPSRSKRKEPPLNLMAGRNPKQLRGLLNGGKPGTTGDNTPDVVEGFGGKNPIDEAFEDHMEEEAMDDGSDDGDLALTGLLPTGPDTAEWQATIQRVVRNVVSIRFCLTCSFDTDGAVTSEATGFVVDSERG